MSDIDKLLQINQGLIYYGKVTGVPGVNQFTIPKLMYQGAGKFTDATNPWSAYVFRDAAGLGALPQGEQRLVTAYDPTTGIFGTPAFSAAVGIGDEILLMHPVLRNSSIIIGMLFGVPVTNYVDANNFQAIDLAGYGETALVGWWINVVWDSGGAGAAPQSEWKQVTAYVSAPGQFSHAAFTANLANGDRIKIVPPEIYEALTIRGGANTIQDVMDDLAANLDLARSAQSATTTTTGAEQTLYDSTIDDTTVPFEYGGSNIFLHNMGAANTIILREYIKGWAGGDWQLATDDAANTYNGVQAVTRKQFDREYNQYGVKIAMELTAGANIDVIHEHFDSRRS